MKRFARVSSVVVLMMALTLALAAPVFAADGGTLKFLRSTPDDGGKNVPIDNVGVKLFFDGDVTDPSVWDANKTGFTLSDSKKNPVDYSAYPGHKDGEEGYILVLATPKPAEGQPAGQLEQKSDYTLTISGDLLSRGGATLGEDIDIDFRTMDVAANSKISMILMAVMLVGMIALMFITNGRKIKAEAEAAALMKANPYRIAKEKKITVDEAKALIEKAKERNKAQLAKVGGKAPEPESKKSSVPKLESKKKKKDVHSVGGPRPISEGGGKYKSAVYWKERKAAKARKAKAEAARKAAAAGQRQGGTGAKKTTKGKGKKK